MNHVVNPVLVLLLRSPLGRRMGRHLAVLTYVGRRSGRRRGLVVQYAREGTQVWIVPGQPKRKTWWRNMRPASAVELRLAGQEFRGRAVALLEDDHPDELRGALAAYLRQLPRAAKALGVDSVDGGAETDSFGPSGGMVVVQVDLDVDPVV